MQEKNRESNQKNAQKEPSEQKNQKTTASDRSAGPEYSGPAFLCGFPGVRIPQNHLYDIVHRLPAVLLQPQLYNG